MKLNQKIEASRKKRKATAAGLASTSTCLCGWTVPNSRYQGDQNPSRQRLAHWRDCVRCKGPCPLKLQTQSKAPVMRETHSQIAARLLLLAKKVQNTWGHCLHEHVVVHGVGRLWKCSKCDAVDSPYLILHANCPNAIGPSLKYSARVQWSVQLRKQARAEQRDFRAKATWVKRLALNNYKDQVTKMSQANIDAHKKRRRTE